MIIIALLTNGKGITVNMLEIAYIKELEGDIPPLTLIKLRSGETLSIDNSYSSIIEYLDNVL